MNNPSQPQASLGLEFPEDVATPAPTDGAILPDWHSAKAILAIPNCILRSELFAATRGSNTFMKRAPLKTLSGISIIYTGPRLTQSDLDVWHGILTLAKMQHDPDLVDMSAKSFLSLIGRSTGKSDREWLKNSIAKQSATTLEITHGDVTYGGSLVDEFYREESTGRYKIRLNKKLARLFTPAAWTAVDWAQRSALQGKPLALWLHAFYSSHRAPFDYKVEKIMELCGGEDDNVNLFRRRLKRALDELNIAIQWQCIHNPDADTISVRHGRAPLSVTPPPSPPDSCT